METYDRKIRALPEVIEGLECCAEANDIVNVCLGACPYYGERDGTAVCLDLMQADALFWLKELKERLKVQKSMLEKGSEVLKSGDLISREELEKALSMMGRMYIDGIADDKAYLQEQRVYEVIRNVRTVEAEPVVHAHWINMQEDEFTDGMWRCSACSSDRYFDIMTPLEAGCYRCPNCGAHMDEEVADG